MNLFQLGDFSLHSGSRSRWKIDCDALTDGDLTAIAIMIVEIIPGGFGGVYGIPRGGTRLAEKLLPHVTTGPVLIVDDVLTTGASMDHAARKLYHEGKDVVGAVIFARGQCQNWVKPLFTI